VVIFDLPATLVQASQLQRSEVYVPQPTADFFEADVFARPRVGDADPAFLPANPAVAADEPDFIVAGYSRGASCRGRARPDDRYTDAGVS
jgi:hypothetical protein